MKRTPEKELTYPRLYGAIALSGFGVIAGLSVTGKVAWFTAAGLSITSLPFIPIGCVALPASLAYLWLSRVPLRVVITEPDVRHWRVFIGIGRNGRRFYHDFNSIPHCKIGGVTGSGKSKAIELILAQVIVTKRPSEVSIHIIDMKGGASFAHFSTVPHVAGRIYSHTEDALYALREIRSTMEYRLEQIQQARAAFRPVPRFPHIIIFTDEGGELAPAYAHDSADKKLRQQCLAEMSSIARVGREPGIHLVYTTQRPSDETLPVAIRGQMDATLAFRTQNELDSNILLRNENAASLPNVKGRMLYQTPNGEYTVQTAIVPDSIVKQWIQDAGGITYYDVGHKSVDNGDKVDRRAGLPSSMSDTVYTDIVGD